MSRLQMMINAAVVTRLINEEASATTTTAIVVARDDNYTKMTADIEAVQTFSVINLLQNIKRILKRLIPQLRAEVCISRERRQRTIDH